MELYLVAEDAARLYAALNRLINDDDCSCNCDGHVSYYLCAWCEARLVLNSVDNGKRRIQQKPGDETS